MPIDYLTPLPIPFKRTFSAIDALVAIPFEELHGLYDKWRNGNAQEHVEAVARRRTKKGKKTKIEKAELSGKKIELISVWMAGASHFGSDEPELGAAWRAALDRILDDTNDAEEILNALNTLPPSTLKLFLDMWRPAGTNFLSRLRVQFTNQEEVRKLADAKFLKRTPLSAVVPILGIMIGIPYAFLKIEHKLPFDLDTAIAGIFLIAVTFLVGLTYRITASGKEFLRIYLEYASMANKG
jgi:hypothetical protein